MRAFLVAGTSSSCGKTTISLGLMAAFSSMGLKVQPFKSGPDYIDPAIHKSITNTPSYNIDTWLETKESIISTFAKAMQNDDISTEKIGIVEGVMGLFDSASGTTEKGSSAHLAKYLKLPIILAVNAKGMARSIAALVHGYANFDKDLNVVGVICTNVGSDNHAKILEDSLANVKNARGQNIKFFGAIKVDKNLIRPSRHLGLEMPASEEFNKRKHLADVFTNSIALDEILKSCEISDLNFEVKENINVKLAKRLQSKVKVAISNDEAFCFIYQSLIDNFKEFGAEVVYFSPLNDDKLPPCDAVWICGGYPELYAEKLSQNTSMLEDIRKFAKSGKPIHGECGGYMYMMQEIETNEKSFKMLGLVPFSAKLGEKLAALGYRKLEPLSSTSFGMSEIYGHEFHYSSIVSKPKSFNLWKIYNRDNIFIDNEGWLDKNISASWVHIYPNASKDAIFNFLQSADKND